MTDTEFQKNIKLSDYTTIGLGGDARYFFSCGSPESLTSALEFAGKNNLRVQIISGGSNIIFPDRGFDGIVIKIDMKGVDFHHDGEIDLVNVKAGENWDEFVKLCIENHLAGIECLSGIPGSVGATPVQNVGAYGQEVQNTIVSVKALDRENFEIKNFNNNECKFDYRMSKFKNKEKDKYIITEVTFRLKKFGKPVINYEELKKQIQSNVEIDSLQKGKEQLTAVRENVISIRKKKSMIIDKTDPDARSCGSFFLNPILKKQEFNLFIERAGRKKFPYYKFKEDYKIPAAWLVEQSGFSKGYRHGDAGISKNHSLAVVNYGSRTEDVLNLAKNIENAVLEKFGIQLSKEPEIVN